MEMQRLDPLQRRLEPSPLPLSPVKETTMYPAQFPILLRERLQGKTVLEAAEILGVDTDAVFRLLAGEWRPSKAVCAKLGLKVVYALSESR